MVSEASDLGAGGPAEKSHVLNSSTKQINYTLTPHSAGDIREHVRVKATGDSCELDLCFWLYKNPDKIQNVADTSQHTPELFSCSC